MSNLQDHGPRAGDLRCVELSLFVFVSQLDSAQCYFSIPECLKPQHRVTPLLRLPVILLNQVIQVLAGPDERKMIEMAALCSTTLNLADIIAV